MRTIKRICNNCDIEFLADPREVNRGNAKYCNLSCAMKNQTINQPLVLKKCEICNASKKINVDIWNVLF